MRFPGRSMKAVVALALISAQMLPFRAGAATGQLKSQESNGFRRTCVYEFKGRTESVRIADGKTCPLEYEIDLFSGPGARKERRPRKNAGNAIFSGELEQGATKSCAYRDLMGKAYYRNVKSNESCPGAIGL